LRAHNVAAASETLLTEAATRIEESGDADAVDDGTREDTSDGSDL